MPHTTVWDASYEAIPSDSLPETLGQGAGRIRNLKRDARQRAEIDHEWASVDDGGKHKKVTLIQQGADAAPAGTETALYTKDVSGVPEVFLRTAAAGPTQVSKAGKLLTSGMSNPTAILSQTQLDLILAALLTNTTTVADASALGLLDAYFGYSTAAIVRLTPKHGTKVKVEIDGVVVSHTGALSFTLPTDLETGAEAASTRYYCYVSNEATVLTPHISVTVPLIDPTLKVGYHPTEVDWRCVGSFFNDASSNIHQFYTDGKWIRWIGADAGLIYALSGAVPKAWASQALTVPIGTRAVCVHVHYVGRRGSLVFGASNAPGTLPSGAGPHALTLASMAGVLAQVNQATDSSGIAVTEQFELPIADPSAPAIRWGAVEHVASQVLSSAELKVIGYFDPHLPG